MITLLISGKAGHGKDYFSSILKDKFLTLEKRIVIIHFADTVKEFAKLYYGFDGDKNRIENRTLLQYIGTDLMRNYDKDYWARIVGEFIAAAKNDFDIAIIPDTRFQNEIDVIKYYCSSVKTIRIQRFDENGNIYINPNLTDIQYNHISETALDNYSFDYLINNYTNDIKCLLKSANEIVEDLRKQNILV